MKNILELPLYQQSLTNMYYISYETTKTKIAVNMYDLMPAYTLHCDFWERFVFTLYIVLLWLRRNL